MVVSLKKSDADAGEVPYVSRAPMVRPTVVAGRSIDEVSPAKPVTDRTATDRTATDESPDRSLRHLLILGNVIAWLVIIIAIRLAFF
jgi:hypothetical protein